MGEYSSCAGTTPLSMTLVGPYCRLHVTKGTGSLFAAGIADVKFRMSYLRGLVYFRVSSAETSVPLFSRAQTTT